MSWNVENANHASVTIFTPAPIQPLLLPAIKLCHQQFIKKRYGL
jgi:hypothetical protein